MAGAPFQKVLVPLDGSPLAATALLPLRRLAARAPTEVTLLRVVGPLDAADDPVARRALEAQADEASRQLGADVRVRVEVLRGDPAQEIVRHARASGQELVVMTTHGRTGLARLARGSVAEQVLRTSEVPLLLCNPHGLDAGEQRFRQLLVPTDCSYAAESVLPAVERVAAANDALVTLLVVEPRGVTEPPTPLLAGGLWDPVALERALAPTVDRLERAGLRVDTTSAAGDVAAEILRAAGSTDLLAMATHGWSGAARWWFGSVTEQVLRQARCPLLVARTVWP